MSYPNRLYINAKYAFNEEDEEPSNFTAELPIGLEYVKSIQLNQGSIVYTPVYPNITPRDNIFEITYNGVLQSFTLPATRVYSSPTDLCNVLNTITGGAVGTFSFDANYVRIDYTPVLPADTWRFEAVANNVLQRLGARDSNVSIPVAPATNTGNYQFELYPKLLRTSTLYLTCSASDTSRTNRIGAGVPDILSMYPLTSGEVGSVLLFEAKTRIDKADTISNTIRNLTFELRDDNFDIIEMSHNTPVNLEISIDYEEIVDNNTQPFPLTIFGT